MFSYSKSGVSALSSSMKAVVLTSGNISSLFITIPPTTASSISSSSIWFAPRIGAEAGLATSAGFSLGVAGFSSFGFSSLVKASTSGKCGAFSSFSTGLGSSFAAGASAGFSTGLGCSLAAGASIGFSSTLGCSFTGGALGASSLAFAGSGLGGCAGGGVVIITGSSALAVSFGFSGCGFGFSGCGFAFCLGIVSRIELAYFSMISLR